MISLFVGYVWVFACLCLIGLCFICILVSFCFEFLWVVYLVGFGLLVYVGAVGFIGCADCVFGV